MHESHRSTRHHQVTGDRAETWVVPLGGSRAERTPLPNALQEQEQLPFAVLDLFPIPIRVATADGGVLFTNRPYQDDPPIVQDMETTDYMERVLSGEILSLRGIKVPTSRGENIYQDIVSFPLFYEDGAVAYILTAFIVKGTSEGNPEVLKARQYIDEHWLEDIDPDHVAKLVGIGRHHLTRMFKRHFGVTPHSYYQALKVDKIKERLADLDLTISQAFSLCGVSYHGGFAKAFKAATKMTPSQYRKSLQQGLHANPPTFLSLPDNYKPEQLFQIAELFPIPIQIFAKNGDIVYINEAVLRMWNVKDASKILGTYNLLTDPFANEKPELRAGIRSVYAGEVTLVPDVRIPLDSFWEWYAHRSPVWNIEAIYTDILNFPVFYANGQIAYVVSLFFTSRIYQGRPEVAKAREYLENHWREEFDIDKVAEAASLSPSHLARVFKKHSGMTLYEYYQQIRVNRLKKALQNKNLSIAEAFVACGFPYPGNFARFFREHMGMTPSQYRKALNDEHI